MDFLFEKCKHYSTQKYISFNKVQKIEPTVLFLLPLPSNL